MNYELVSAADISPKSKACPERSRRIQNPKSRKRLVAALLVVLFVTLGCLGPKPVLQGEPVVEPPEQGSDQPFRVEAVIKNQGPGAGEAEVEVSLTNKQTGEFIAKDSEQVDLQPEETVHVLIEVQLPPSAKDLDPQNIEVEVDAHYPIE